MRRLVSAILILLGTLGSPLAQDVMTACGHHDYPPWNWKKGDQIVGVCAEITSRIFEPLGITVKHDYVGPWKRCQKYVESGRVDVNICAFVNKDRERYSVFMDTPMGQNDISVFVPAEKVFSFEDLRDLEGMRSIMISGVSIGQFYDDFIETKTIHSRLDSRDQAYRFLDAGRADFFVTGKQIGIVQRNLYGFEEKITVLPTPIGRGNIFISMSKKSRFLEYLPEAENVLKDPAYPEIVDALLNKYTDMYVKDFVGQ